MWLPMTGHQIGEFYNNFSPPNFFTHYGNQNGRSLEHCIIIIAIVTIIIITTVATTTLTINNINMTLFLFPSRM